MWRRVLGISSILLVIGWVYCPMQWESVVWESGLKFQKVSWPNQFQAAWIRLRLERWGIGVDGHIERIWIPVGKKVAPSWWIGVVQSVALYVEKVEVHNRTIGVHTTIAWKRGDSIEKVLQQIILKRGEEAMHRIVKEIQREIKARR